MHAEEVAKRPMSCTAGLRDVDDIGLYMGVRWDGSDHLGWAMTSGRGHFGSSDPRLGGSACGELPVGVGRCLLVGSWHTLARSCHRSSWPGL